MTIDHSRLIAALRDTAAKATEMKAITEKASSPRHAAYNYVDGPGEQTFQVEAYSKDWIAGRLLGMADTLEAMTPATPGEPDQ